MPLIQKTVVFLLNLLITLSFLMSAVLPVYAASEGGKISLAIYPFNDVRRDSLDMNIPAVLRAEFSGYEYIEIVPVEVISEKLYEIEPQFMWTEKKDSVKRGGILWKIEPKIIKRINDTVSAQYSLYGDLTGFGDTWVLDAFLIKEGEPEFVRPFKFTGMKYDELPAKLTGMSKGIAAMLESEAELQEAEEEIRQYKGGMISHDGVIVKMKKHISTVPKSIPLRALLLDLYINDNDKNRKEIIDQGLKIIEFLGRGDDKDTRYLLSLSLDPFDAVAGVYERNRDWDNAIAIRDKALRLFPYNAELHKEGIGRNYYYTAKSFEEKGNRVRAMESYNTALSYLLPSSGYFKQAMDGIDRLKGKGAPSD